MAMMVVMIFYGTMSSSDSAAGTAVVTVLTLRTITASMLLMAVVAIWK